MANPWTAAWEEAEASVPPDLLVYCTLELRHPAFIEDGAPIAIRVVSGVPDDMQFGIEPGAPMDGGETVTFKAVMFYAERPEFSEGRAPECLVTVDNVARDLVPILEQAVEVKADLQVAYREYRSDDLTEPCYGPVDFVMRSATMSGTSIEGTAKLDDLANSKFPFPIYTIRQFPGLLG